MSGETGTSRRRRHLVSLLSAAMAALVACGIAFSSGNVVLPAAGNVGVVLTVEAKEKTTDYVATTALNIRSKADKSGKKLGSFTKGDTVKVYSITKGWAKISYNKSTAYVSADYLAEPGSASDPNMNAGASSHKNSSAYKASASGAYSGNSNANAGGSGTMVWLSATGSKYHSRNNCGRMNPNKATQVSRSYAESAGYDACSKCW